MPVSSALDLMGIRPNPVGTLEELRKEGLDPLKVGSCAPNSRGVRGCACYDDCPFVQAKNGGFRDQGPRNIGYVLITDEGNGKRDSISCFNFTKILEKRRLHGYKNKLEGYPYEIIRVIAQQGETIKRRIWVPIDPKDTNKGYHDPIEEHVIPKFPRPSELGALSYTAQLLNEEAKYQELEELVLGKLGESMMEDIDEKPVTESVPVVAEPEPETVLVKRGPGRPRKVVDEQPGS